MLTAWCAPAGGVCVCGSTHVRGQDSGRRICLCASGESHSHPIFQARACNARAVSTCCMNGWMTHCFWHVQIRPGLPGRATFVIPDGACLVQTRHCTRAVYTSPIKTISNQKYRDFGGTFDVRCLKLFTPRQMGCQAHASCAAVAHQGYAHQSLHFSRPQPAPAVVQACCQGTIRRDMRSACRRWDC